MNKTSLYMAVAMLVIINGCVKLDEPTAEQIATKNLVEEGPMAGMNVPDHFSFATSKNIAVHLTVPDFLSGAGFSLFLTPNPSDSLSFASASFSKNGKFIENFELPFAQDSITVRSNYVGLTHSVTIPIENGSAVFDYTPLYSREETPTGKSGTLINKSDTSFQQNGFTFLAPFDANGVPTNLLPQDIIQKNLLDDVNASLPESKKLPDSHPEYLAGKETNIILNKEADVWVTFVGEGAGYKNTLGYYTYTMGEEPTTIADITEHFIIFPNVSMKNSGGGLLPGDRVHLGRFPANTVVSWFLVANGFTGTGIGKGSGTHYSQPELNKEANPDLKKHMVLLYDVARELTILGFEDIPRDSPSCDQDFNDAIFYAKTNPADALTTNNLATIDTANDADGDGINDELDYFPYDPDVAFNNFSPSANSTGTLAYEDLWPSQGDYDFNDLVVSYNYNLLANSDGLISRIEAKYKVEQIGAAFHNGFAITLPIAPTNIKSVSNQNVQHNYFNIAQNGTEEGTESKESVILIADDTYSLLGQEITIEIAFENPLPKEELGAIPFNPFIMVNGERGKEVHLPDLKPTSKAKFLGEKEDYSDATKNRFYKTKKNLPWALNVYGLFEPPKERVPIILTYPKFVLWANSAGTIEQNWYLK